MDILAQVINTTVIVASITGSSGIILGFFFKHITNRKIHMNGVDFISHELCTARRESIDERYDALKDDIQEIKVDVKELLKK